MIKAIVGFRKKPNADIKPLLQRMMSYAGSFSGFSKVECIEMLPERSVVALVYEWKSLDDWKSWELSRVRKQLMESAEQLLVDKPHVTVYKEEPMPGWTYTALKQDRQLAGVA
ncbi:hypothetical protein Dform_02059 [Dehalogenimonas formicexedens]|uniref:Antibiotic biosynthesis monooxygenase n=1 Tax=Dehalogenimonas formicexedens TaxID=1839801 RepID=A0A1P8FAA8_9CHLR|nr:hypothetical protein [Dehalogenimonas formicexedens]APV45368.1 hypothetical protein Dform_02059 [Dehalogenimonas formicexedens]